MKNILWIAGLVGLMGQSEAGISKKNTGNGIEMIIKRVRDYSRNTSGTKGKIFLDFWSLSSIFIGISDPRTEKVVSANQAIQLFRLNFLINPFDRTSNEQSLNVMQAVLIARMPYTCNSCGDAIDDIDVIQFQCHCMSYDIFQKFIFRKNLLDSSQLFRTFALGEEKMVNIFPFGL